MIPALQGGPTGSGKVSFEGMQESPLLMSTRASAVRPAKARQMWSSTLTILRADRASCSFAALFRSAPACNWSTTNQYD